MAVHPSIAARLPMLDGRTTWTDALADAAVRPRIEEFVFWPESESLPTVDIGQTRVPGPHGPITIRIYRSSAQLTGPGPTPRPRKGVPVAESFTAKTAAELVATFIDPALDDHSNTATWDPQSLTWEAAA